MLLKLSNTLSSFIEGYLKTASPFRPGGNIAFHSLSFRQLPLSTTSIKRVLPLIPQALQIYKLIFGLFLVAQLGKNPLQCGRLGSIPGLGRSPGEGKGYPLQYSGLENSKESIVHGVAKSLTQLSDFLSHFFTFILSTCPLEKPRQISIPESV